MNKKIKILFLAADPKNFGRLRLGEECREIEKEIKLRSNQDSIEIIPKFAVTTRELRVTLEDYLPDIIHFSGHGNEEGIVLEDASSKGHTVPMDALARLFGMFKSNIRLVFLNACYSKYPVQAFKQTIDFTIGLRESVGDAAAILFASTFYGGLSCGHPVKLAFDLAESQIRLDGLLDKNNYRLFIKKGVDRSSPFLKQDSPAARSSRNGSVLRGRAGASVTKIEEPKTCLWIHGWVKRLYDCLPTVELDWTEYFDRDKRKVPSQRVWNHSLYEELRGAKKIFNRQKKGSFIDFRGLLPLTSVLAIGAMFPEVGGYRFRAEQPTRGKTALWRSDATPSKRKFKITQVKKNKGGCGQDILIALAITGSAKEKVVDLYNKHSEIFSAMIYAEPDSGPGDGALRSDRDAVALAIQAKELIRQCELEYKPSQIHLVVYGPAAYCLFLGQRLNALGKIVTYERILNKGYKRSVTIQTG